MYKNVYNYTLMVRTAQTWERKMEWGILELYEEWKMHRQRQNYDKRNGKTMTNEPAKTNEKIKATAQVQFEHPEMLVIQPLFTVYPCSHCGHCEMEGKQSVDVGTVFFTTILLASQTK